MKNGVSPSPAAWCNSTITFSMSALARLAFAPVQYSSNQSWANETMGHPES